MKKAHLGWNVRVAHVFISYVEEDSRVAGKLAQLLHDAGFTTWRYESDAKVGRNYLLQTREQIESCDAFLIILSPQSVLSNQIELEVIRAHECGKPMLPVLSGMTYQEFGEQRPDWQQAMGGATAITLPGNGDIEPAADRLIDGIEDLIGGNQDRANRLRRDMRRRWRIKRALRAAAILLVIGGLAAGGLAGYRALAGTKRDAEAKQCVSDAKTHLRDMKDDEALKCLNRAIELAPEYWEAYLLRADVHLWGGRSAEALRDADAVLKNNPDDGEALWYRHWALRDLGRLEEALQILTTYIDRSLGTRDAEYQRGQVNLLLKKFDDAIRDYSQHIQKHPGWPDGYIGRAYALIGRTAAREPDVVSDFQMWLTQKSVDDLRDAADDCSYVLDRIERSMPEAMACRGMAWLMQGWVGLAAGDFAEALDSNRLQPELRVQCQDGLTLVDSLPRVSGLVMTPSVNASSEGRQGIAVLASFEIEGAEQLKCLVDVAVADQDGRTFSSRRDEYSSVYGAIGRVLPFTPTSQRATVKDLAVFVPFDELPCATGQNYMQYYATVMCGRARIADIMKGPLLFTYPPPPLPPQREHNSYEMFDER